MFVEPDPQLDIISTLLSISKSGEFIYYQVCIFSLSVLNGCKIISDEQLVTCIISEIIRTKDFKDGVNIDGCDIDEYISNFIHVAPAQVRFSSYSLAEIDCMCSDLLRKCNNLDSNVIEELYKLAKFSVYTEVVLFLLEMKSQYKDCLEYFVRAQDKRVKCKVFNWIHDIHLKLDVEQQSSFQDLLLDYIHFLLHIDINKTEEIIYQYYSGNLFQIIRMMKKFPSTQKSLLEKVSPDELPDDLIVKNVELLCKLSPELLFCFLHALDYNKIEDNVLETCIKECMENDQIYPAVFLLEKQHKLQDCFNIMIEKSREDLLQMSKHSKVLRINLEKLFDSFYQDTMKAIQLCRDNPEDFHIEEVQNNMFEVLFLIIDCYKQFNALLGDLFEASIQEIIKENFSILMNCTSLDAILTRITLKFSDIPFNFFSKSIFHLFSIQAYLQKTLRKSINLLEVESETMSRDLFKKYKRGVSSEENCSNCKVQLHSVLSESQKILIFYCGHRFHRGCLKSEVCSICFKQSNQRSTVALYFINRT